MKEFFWKYFQNTGNVDAYLIYKEPLEQEEGQALDREEELAKQAEVDIFS
ncbi:MAG: YqzL family protein [Gorillibacterium sp.]|nr:YqzL family protein [Gorillibacterium sp.]